VHDADVPRGRLSQGFSLRTLQHLVLDEADRILSLDFEEDIDKILKVRGALDAAQRQRTRHACGLEQPKAFASAPFRAHARAQVIPAERRTQLFSATMTSKARLLRQHVETARR
jgi:superfamily II DNA/RNA helicase